MNPTRDRGPTSTFGDPAKLLQRGRRLEYAALGWNVVGVVVLTIGAIGAIAAGSVAPIGRVHRAVV